MSELWRVEFHAHTCYSPDALIQPQDLIRRARQLGLDKVCITDHNTIQGARKAHALAPDLIVIGEEIRTTAGEFIAFYVQEEVPPGLSPEETLERLREQGAVIAISHPFDITRGSAMGPENARQWAPHVDAIEVFNARCPLDRFNEEAEALAQHLHLGRFGGSDAHSGWELGRVVTHLPPFHDADTLRQALHTARVEGQRSPHWVHLISTGSKWLKRLGFRTCTSGG
ncbi:MAG: PHP domain-containing protein [Chloroflexi bacterium]|nr:PHP domain-containing protein [Chloroflexota bacterium]